MEAVYDFKELLNKIKEYILLLEEYIDEERFLHKTETYEETCFLFKKAIVEYAKEGFNCILTGSFYAVNMINRSMIENYVCYYLVTKHRDLELWKYYRIHSYFVKMYQHDNIKLQLDNRFNAILKNYDIDKSILNTKDFRRNYGWTFLLGKNLSFRDLAESVDSTLYEDFKFLSDYSHGVSLLQKQGTFTFYQTILPMYFRFYYCIQSLFLSTYYDGTDIREWELRKCINEMVQNELDELNNSDFPEFINELINSNEES